MEKIRVILAEDHHLVRAAVAGLLSKEPDIDIVGQVADGYELFDKVQTLRPDVLVLDAKMPGHKVIEATRRMKKEFPAIKTLLLSAHNRREYVVGVLREGAAGYVLKDDAPEMLAQAIRAVFQGQEWISPRVTPILLRSVRDEGHSRLNRLTKRETEALTHMAHGLKNGAVAKEMVVSHQTVKNYVRAIFSKLEVSSRVEAVLYALKHGLVEEDSEN